MGRPPWYSMIRSTETMLFSIMLVCRIRKLKFIVTLAEKLLEFNGTTIKLDMVLM